MASWLAPHGLPLRKSRRRRLNLFVVAGAHRLILALAAGAWLPRVSGGHLEVAEFVSTGDQADAEQLVADALDEVPMPHKGDKGGLFQPVDGGFNRVCRGANVSDDSLDDFVVHKGVRRLGDCMRLCIESPVCKGIEFSEKYNGGHCEVWTSASGINATAPVRDFVCLRYGAVEEKFDLIGGASSNRVCRGGSPTDNSEAYYVLHANIPSLNGCKELCVSTENCKGIEYKERGGRCEVWTRTAGIRATVPVGGFTCLRYGEQEHFKPVDSGENRACRGASPDDQSLDYFTLHNETASLEDCKKLCVEAPVCKGIEYNGRLEGGRCEVWTRSAGISATAPAKGFTCLQYGTIAEQFALADGGENRACRGANPDDNSQVYYVLHPNTSTLSACKELCIRAPICKGIEYSPRYDGGRCEVWTRSGGIGMTKPMVGSACLRYGSSTERFEPVDGGENRVCRGAAPGDDSPGYYELHLETHSLSECKTLCINAPVCRGIEYIAERRRCEVWTRIDGVSASMPFNGSTCLHYGPSAQFDFVDGGIDRACRGASTTDHSPSYFTLHTDTESLAACQALCVGTPDCKGVEYNAEYDNGRCEVWTRAGGITATSQMSGSLCLSYQVSQAQFHPVDGGTNRACRGAGLDDNDPANYVLHQHMPSLGACKALCIDTPLCRGIEYNEAYDGGRCEIWTAKGGILATKPSQGSTCLSFGPAKGRFEVLDGGMDRVCRGASPRDDSASFYVLHTNVPSLQGCKDLCVEAPICKGIEHTMGYNGGRCEVWTRLGGIRATAPGNGSTCHRYGTSEPFTPIEGGEGRACRGATPGDDSPDYYILHTGVPSLDDCKMLCANVPACKGLEYNMIYDGGRCEVWTRTGGISATAAMSGSQCLLYGTAELFRPVDGALNRACRGASEMDDSHAYYVLHHDIPSLGACKSLCVDTTNCRGIEYSGDFDGGRCEVWTRVGGIGASRHVQGASCYHYGETQLEFVQL